MIQERELDLFEKAYRYFYSKKGSAKVGGCYRSIRDWYEVLYPTIAEGKMTKEQTDEYIKNTVMEYCEQFWTNKYSEAYNEACEINDVSHFTTYPHPEKYIQEQINNNYFAELMEGHLKSVITAIRRNLEVVANSRYRKSLQDMADMVNTEIETLHARRTSLRNMQAGRCASPMPRPRMPTCSSVASPTLGKPQ